MKNILSLKSISILVVACTLIFVLWTFLAPKNTTTISLEQETATSEPAKKSRYNHPRLRGLEEWSRPVGPPHVAIQIGHLEVEHAPEELAAIRKNTGSQHASITETATVQKIAELTKEKLESRGLTVKLFPTTIEPNYWADVFISLHADGSENTNLSGYKIARSWYDFTGKGDHLVASLEDSYEKATGLPHDPNITANMRGYYGFNWYKFEHSAHPMAVSAIIETGFLTNTSDRGVIVDQPEKAAAGIASGIINFLTS